MENASVSRAAVAVTSFALAGILLGACGGGGGSPTAPPTPTLRTVAVSGTSTATSANSCSGGSHDFLAAEGPISITLNTTSGGVGMGVQVCAGGIDNNNCSINLVPIAVGQTITGTRRGDAGQTLKFNTANCGGAGPAPANPVNYTATLSYFQ